MLKYLEPLRLDLEAEISRIEHGVLPALRELGKPAQLVILLIEGDIRLARRILDHGSIQQIVGILTALNNIMPSIQLPKSPQKPQKLSLRKMIKNNAGELLWGITCKVFL